MQTILTILVVMQIARIIPRVVAADAISKRHCVRPKSNAALGQRMTKHPGFYGFCRFDRIGIRLADYVVTGLRARGEDVELIDAKVIGFPILERMYKEYVPGAAAD
jgi:hypothetical protein